MPLKTLFGLLIRFIYNFTSHNYNYLLHYYLFTQLHSLQSVHSNIPILFGASGIHLETADR
jgi:hypothetical protein